MVEYEEIIKLATKASELWLQHEFNIMHKANNDIPMQVDNFKQLATKVVHDHQWNFVAIEEDKNENAIYDNLIKLPKESAKRRHLKEKWKLKLQEARYLMNFCEVPLTTVSKRLKINYRRLLYIKRNNIGNPVAAFDSRRFCRPFAKLHQKVRKLINDFLINATHPVQSTEILAELKRTYKLNVSQHTLTKYLRKRLNVSYRSIK